MGSPGGEPKRVRINGRPTTVSSTGRGRRLAVVFLALTLVVTGAGAGISVGTTTPDAESSRSFQLDRHTPTNNTTRHEHPDRISGQQDLVTARRWLAGRMSTQLESCVVEVGLGTTNVCEFDEEYPDWVRKYVDVAEETDSEDDDRRADVFDRSKGDHQTYSRAVADFTRTYEEYQAAKEAGDDEQARTLARELQRHGDTVTGSGEDMLRDYRVLEEEATVSLDDAKVSVNETLENVSETLAEVETAEFNPTVLRADITPREISFLEPGTITGRLTTENGSGVANRSIDLGIGDREITTRTDEAGRFTLEYRPTTVPLSTSELVVRYQPADESGYLASRATVPVSIVQVDPSVSVSLGSRQGAFRDEIRISGTVSADGIDAQDVPVRVVVDGRNRGTVRTAETGVFAFSFAIGASDGPGQVDVRVIVALEDRALASADRTVLLTIVETATAMDLETSETDVSEMTVDGRLTTRAGAAVPNQPVTLLVNGTPVESVRTAADGTYRTRLSVPSSLLSDDGNTTIGLVARFDGSETNLEPSNARVVLTLPPPSQDRGDGPVQRVVDPIAESARLALQDGIDSATRSPWPWVLGIVGIGVVLVLLYFRDRLQPDWTGGPRGGAQPSETDTTPEPPSEPDQETTPVTPFASARTRLDAEPDAAVMLAYATVRDRLVQSGRVQGRSAETHWEFLTACRQDGLDADAVEGLTELTQTYESSAYAPAAVSRSEAEAAVTIAERLVRSIIESASSG